MSNYIIKVERPEGRVTRVVANVNGVDMTFARGRDGKPVEVSRSRNAMIYDHGSLYIPKIHYAGVIRQVYGVFNRTSKKQEA